MKSPLSRGGALECIVKAFERSGSLRKSRPLISALCTGGRRRVNDESNSPARRLTPVFSAGYRANSCPREALPFISCQDNERNGTRYMERRERPVHTHKSLFENIRPHDPGGVKMGFKPPFHTREFREWTKDLLLFLLFLRPLVSWMQLRESSGDLKWKV